MLKLADHLKLPTDVVTQTIAILAKRRAGKSYLMRRFVEQLHANGQHVVLVDPKGDQHGIRSSADGKGAGLPFVILGGERGDVPLEANGGELVAKLVVEERVSAVLDLSLFRKYEVATFMTGFMEALYRLKAREIYRTPMMLVIDEADAIAPQKPQKGEERMLGAAEDIVRRGGQRGIGCVLVSQRSAVLNKNVLTQAQILVALRTIAPQDLDAMKAWIDVHGTEEERRTLMESLPSLPVGDAWFWSPGWPTVDGIFKRVHVLPIETFDSGATPKPGEQRKEPKTVADVDLEALKRQMTAVIEKSKAEDPKLLRAEITRLNAQVKRLNDEHVKSEGKISKSEGKSVAALTDADRAAIEKFTKQFSELENVLLGDPSLLLAKYLESVERAVQSAYSQFEGLHLTARRDFAKALESKGFQNLVAKLANMAPASTPPRPNPAQGSRSGVCPIARTDRPAPRVVSRPVSIDTAASNGNLGGPEMKILSALAELEALGLHPADKQQLGFLAGYTNIRSGGFSEPMGRLMRGGYAESPITGKVALTAAGRAAAGEVTPPQSSEELQLRIMGNLTGPEQKLLRVLIDSYPNRMTKEELAAASDPPYTNISYGGFSEPLGRLNTLGLVDTPVRGEVVAAAALFLEG